MKRRLKFLIVALLAVVSMGSMAKAEAKGLLGKRYVSVGVDVMKPGNDVLKSIESSILETQIKFNAPATSNLDFNFDIAYSKYDSRQGGVDVDVKKLGLDTGLTYHFSPEGKINPFIRGNLSYRRTEVEGESAGIGTIRVYTSGLGWYSRTVSYNTKIETKEDDFGGTITAGLECALGEKASITPSVLYYKIGDYDDSKVSVDLVVWLTDSLIWKIGAGYAFDEGDTHYGTSIGFSF